MQSSTSKGFKFFLIALVISLPFWWGANIFQENLENYFYAQISQPFQEIVKIKIPERTERPKLELEAKSAISALVNSQGNENIIFQNNSVEKLPIASLTKLMTANIVLENYDLSKEIKISKESVGQEENFGKLQANKIFSVEYLLYPLLMESSNDAAFSLANDYEGITEDEFVELMNLKAEELNLKNTHFINPTGLDPKEQTRIGNYSTTEDLVKFIAKDLLKKPLIWKILATPEYNLYGPELINTNELLKETPDILGGKTGWTDKAGGCMALVLKSQKGNGYFINVILGASSPQARFKEMKKLINWLDER